MGNKIELEVFAHSKNHLSPCFCLPQRPGWHWVECRTGSSPISLEPRDYGALQKYQTPPRHPTDWKQRVWREQMTCQEVCQQVHISLVLKPGVRTSLWHFPSWQAVSFTSTGRGRCCHPCMPPACRPTNIFPLWWVPRSRQFWAGSRSPGENAHSPRFYSLAQHWSSTSPLSPRKAINLFPG